MYLYLLMLLSAFVFINNTPEIRALKRIKRKSELQLHNNIKKDFALFNTENRDNEETIKKMEKNDSSSNNNLKFNKTSDLKRQLEVNFGKREDSSLSNSHPVHMFKTTKKPVMSNSYYHSPLLQHLYQPNDDFILGYILNSIEGPQEQFYNTKFTSNQINNPYDLTQTHTIIYEPPMIFKQSIPANQPKQMENIMDKALTNLLFDQNNNVLDNDNNENAIKLECPIHQERCAGCGGLANEIKKKQKNTVDDTGVIQYCSCHLIKKKN